MDNVIQLYALTVVAIGVTGGLILLQLLIADVLGIVAGHEPGTSVASDHHSILFRAVRAHANTNESVSAFILLTAFALLSAAAPSWLNAMTITYVVGRIGHMCFYYANYKALRSISFGVSIVGLIGILVAGCASWLP